MKTTFKNAWGYQGDAMNLPVGDINTSLPFYTGLMGFEVISKDDGDGKSAILARPDVKFRIVENGGDPTQDGCAFEVDNVESLLSEFRQNGFEKEASDIKIENSHGATWKVFYVVAPDGLCYWLGERLPA